jgi:DNA-binding NarL/FixJ family response regulator
VSHPRITALSTDVMDRSKFPAGVDFVRSAGELDASADIVVVDLSRPDAIDGVRRLRAEGSTAHVVAYGRHTEVDVLAAARAAGCDDVLARSEFFADVAAALS